MADSNLSGPWALSDVEVFLHQALIPVRLSAISPSGWPTVVSLWFIYEDGVLKCASKPSARITELLRENPKCGFEIAGETPPYHGVRGQGLATLDHKSGPTLLPRLIDRYIGPDITPFRRWLLIGQAEEVGIIIRPIRLMSWDYRKRMQS
mgnify:FL=1